MFDLLLTNGNLATMDGEEPFGLVADGAIGITDGRIAWLGPSAAAREVQAASVRDLGGKVVTPGLVDPHTHIVYGEEGLLDFEVLSQGGGRWDLEPAGAGIWAMTRRTRALSEEALYAASRRRMSRLVANGVTTVESKSGAGLDKETELRQMRVSRALGRDLPVTVVSTYLGAHGLPPEEFAGRRDDYVTFMCEEVLPEAARQGSSTRSTASATRTDTATGRSGAFSTARNPSASRSSSTPTSTRTSGRARLSRSTAGFPPTISSTPRGRPWRRWRRRTPSQPSFRART